MKNINNNNNMNMMHDDNDDCYSTSSSSSSSGSSIQSDDSSSLPEIDMAQVRPLVEVSARRPSRRDNVPSRRGDHRGRLDTRG
jgi:hypothetical protein